MSFFSSPIPEELEQDIRVSDTQHAMPDELGLELSLDVYQQGQQLTWSRVIYIDELSLELDEVDLGWSHQDTRAAVIKHEKHRFKRDVHKYLRKSHQLLTKQEGKWLLAPAS